LLQKKHQSKVQEVTPSTRESTEKTNGDGNLKGVQLDNAEKSPRAKKNNNCPPTRTTAPDGALQNSILPTRGCYPPRAWGEEGAEAYMEKKGSHPEALLGE